MPKPETVDAYIASSPKEARPIMEELREILSSTIPQAEEGISWNVPRSKSARRSDQENHPRPGKNQ